MRDFLKRVKKVLVNEKAKEVILVVDGDAAFGENGGNSLKGFEERFKKSRDTRIEIVRSAEESSLEELMETHWTFFCGLWGRSFPAIGPWLGTCTYSVKENRLLVKFCSELALHALSGRGFEELTQRVIRAVGGIEVLVSLAAQEGSTAGSLRESPGNEVLDEELEEIKRIVRQNIKNESEKSRHKVLIGKAFKGTPKPIKDIIQDGGTVIVEGDICGIETKDLKSEKYCS